MTIQKTKLLRAKRMNLSAGIPQPAAGKNLPLPGLVPDEQWQAVIRSEQHFRMLLETMLQGVVYQDAAGRVIAMNPAAGRILGRTPEEFVGKTSVDVEHHTMREDGSRFPGIKHPSIVALQTGREVRDVVMGVYNPRENDYRWININAVPVFRPGERRPYQVYTIFDDITGRKKSVAALKASETALKQAQRLASVGSWEWDIRNNRHAWSEEIYRIYGRDPALPPAVYPEVQQYFAPESWTRLAAAVEKGRVEGVPYECEAEVVRPDGSHRWIIARGQPVRDDGGRIIKMHGTVQDITERKRTEEVLRQSERQYRTLFNTLIEGFCTIEMIFDDVGKPVDYRFLEVNPAFEKQTGLRHAQGRLMRELAPNHEAHWFEVYGKIALTGEPAHFENEARALGRTYDVYAYRIGGPGSRKVAILFNDITEHKRAEQLLRNANRTLQVIRNCHEAMLRAATEKELLDEICRIIVETGGERMVWVGFAEKNRGKTVRPVANAGVNMDYVARARITWADTPRGRGPVGTAIRTGKVCLCPNTQTDPRFALWRESARRCGYGSVIALPLIIEKKCLGALCIYAPEPDAFDAGEQLLLADLTNDLAFGIATLRLRAGRERLEKEIVQSIEGEQERIGRDLHDGICQMLVGAKFRSVYLEKILDGKFPAAAQEARALEELLNHAVEQTRDLARGLNPVKVSSGGLELALQKLAAGIENNRGPHCFCHFPKPVKMADHNVANQLYRIAQEAVQNAVKHAAAKNISITLVRQDGRVTLTVKDDGGGIPAKLTKSGMGLDNMHTRAKLIGGELEIRRRKHGGTAVTCRLSSTSGAKP